MTRPPDEDEGKPLEKGLAESVEEEDFFTRKRPSRMPPGPVQAEPVEPRIRPKRVDPTPSEVFFGDSLSELLAEGEEKPTEEKDG